MSGQNKEVKAHDVTNMGLTSPIKISNKLITAKWSKLVTNELRLVLYLMSMVDKEDDDFQTYKINISIFKRIIGFSGGSIYAEFKKAAKGLLQKIIEWENIESGSIKYDAVAWCSKCSYYEKHGYIEIRFDSILKPFFLNLQSNFICFSEIEKLLRLNFYSMRIYMLVKFVNDSDKCNNCCFNISDLRRYLDCEKKYLRVNNFTLKVIRKSIENINNVFDCDLQVDLIKRGIETIGYEFSWTELSFKTEEIVHPLVNDLKNYGISRITAENFLSTHGEEAIQQALLAVDDYAKNNTVKTLGALTRKAITQGWVVSSKKIQHDSLEEQKVKEREKQIKFEQEERQRREDEQRLSETIEHFEALSENERKEIFSKYKQYLLDNQMSFLVQNLDKEGLKNPALRGMFGQFYTKMKN